MGETPNRGYRYPEFTDQNVPTVGHLVQVDLHDGSPIVIDRVYGVTSA